MREMLGLKRCCRAAVAKVDNETLRDDKRTTVHCGMCYQKVNLVGGAWRYLPRPRGGE